MILIDCSVLVDSFRKRDPKLAALFKQLTIGICGVTRYEALAGVRSGKERLKVLAVIDGFHQIATEESIWDGIGENAAVLRTNGLNVPPPDIILASVGMHYDIELWARDQHFPLMQKHLPNQRLFQEPP